MLSPAFRLPATVCLFVFLIAAFARPVQALDVNSLRVGVQGDKTRLVIELSEPAKFRTFMLDGPVRLVVDLPTYNWQVKSIPTEKGRGIKQVRQGPLQPGMSRVVIDLEKPSLVHAAFVIPATNGQRHKIVIDFKPSTQSEFMKGKAKVYGNMSARTETAKPAFKAPADQPPPSSTQYFPQAKRPLIVVDAGHGGDDPGALGSQGLREKNITLAMAKDLKAKLEGTGRYRVQLTRSTDVFIRLSERVAIARRANADMFISLHADSISRPSVHGASIYTLSERASDAETEKLAARENRADAIAGLNLDTQDEDVANILVDLAMRDTMNQSKFFANNVVGIFRSNGIDTLDIAHRFAGFAVLKAPDIPSVLIETGYMSNDREAQALSTPEYRDRLATAITRSIDIYFATVK
ncbi:MAG: N-acetylmuramoyl-L-alanine amidase [Micavibrio sp.]|nr:N-acetylmuramoyl-L-alanine amidase [Micavibrio sp.]